MPRPLPSQRDALLILGRRRARPAPRPPPIAARSLVPTIKALEARFGRGVEGLKARWREIVGEALARRTEPVRLSRPRAGAGASLELRVEGAAAVLVQHQAPDILARVNLFLGPGAVERLRISQGPVSNRPARPAPAPRSGRPGPLTPLAPDAEQALGEGLAGVEEGALKTALLHLGRAVHRRGGG
jgi:hypothetical protein